MSRRFWTPLLVIVALLSGVSSAAAAGTISIPEEIHAGESTTVRVTPEKTDPSDEMFFGWLRLKGTGTIQCPFPFPADSTLGGRWVKGFEFRPATKPISIQVQPLREDSNGLYLFCAYQSEAASTAEAFTYAEKLVRILPPRSVTAREPRACGQIPKGSVYSVSATPSVACAKARKIIKKFVFDEVKHPLGFRCHAGREGQYGYAVKCRRGSQRIIGTSGI